MRTPLFRWPMRVETGLWSIPDAPRLFVWKDPDDNAHHPRWYIVTFAPNLTPWRRNPVTKYMGPYTSYHDAFLALRMLVNYATG